MLGFPEAWQQHSQRVLAAVPVPRAQDPADEGGRGWAPWGALGKQRPVLTLVGSGLCHPHPREKKLQGPLCVCEYVYAYGVMWT